ncbi:hypothetical protein FNF28_05426 [Cafeteria roenbergensis]|uniref:Uncharacterized protein n=1 Tax=Cafeteria roenbergensis TaxID=33653 RepID=A0A5A8D885_CAFRO|nr:hypothetical protein FNF28_05426 [Cafeteria roenbergensis]
MADSDFDFDAPTTLRDGEGEADSIDDALFDLDRVSEGGMSPSQAADPENLEFMAQFGSATLQRVEQHLASKLSKAAGAHAADEAHAVTPSRSVGDAGSIGSPASLVSPALELSPASAVGQASPSPAGAKATPPQADKRRRSRRLNPDLSPELEALGDSGKSQRVAFSSPDGHSAGTASIDRQQTPGASLRVKRGRSTRLSRERLSQILKSAVSPGESGTQAAAPTEPSSAVSPAVSPAVRKVSAKQSPVQRSESKSATESEMAVVAQEEVQRSAPAEEPEIDSADEPAAVESQSASAEAAATSDAVPASDAEVKALAEKEDEAFEAATREVGAEDDDAAPAGSPTADAADANADADAESGEQDDAPETAAAAGSSDQTDLDRAAKGASEGAETPFGEKLAKATKALHSRGGPEHAHSAHSSPAGARPLTEPEPFAFSTDARAAERDGQPRPLTTEEREVAELAARKPFRAQPVGAGVPADRAPHSPAAKRELTVAHTPNLATAKLAATRAPHVPPAAPDATAKPFAARPMPAYAPALVGVTRSAAPLTTPFSPELATRQRAAVRAPAPSAEGSHAASAEAEAEAEAHRFRARAVGEGIPEHAPVAAAAPKPPTRPVPFHLAVDERGRAAREREEEERRRAAEAEREAHQFHAQPIRHFASAPPASAAQPPRRPTVAEPFHLRSEALHAAAAEAERARLAAEAKAEAERREFHARPLPCAILDPSHVFVPIKPDRPRGAAALPQAKELPSEARARVRAAFDEERRQRLEAKARQDKEAEERRQREEEAAIARMRRETLTFRARPMVGGKVVRSRVFGGAPSSSSSASSSAAAGAAAKNTTAQDIAGDDLEGESPLSELKGPVPRASILARRRGVPLAQRTNGAASPDSKPTSVPASPQLAASASAPSARRTRKSAARATKAIAAAVSGI